MQLSTIVAAICDAARPFTIYAGGAAVAIGVFVPTVSADKLWIAAAMAGVVGVARSIDNQVQARVAGEVAKAQAQGGGSAS